MRRSLPSFWRLTRKELVPLIKRLHPDMMASSTADITLKDANIRCMQNLNDLWDTLDLHCDKIEQLIGTGASHSWESGSTVNYDIFPPFRDKYDLSCWLVKETTEQRHDVPSSDDYQLVKVIIQPPQIICKRQNASAKVVGNALESVLSQQLSLLKAVGFNNNQQQAHYPSTQEGTQGNAGDPRSAALPQQLLGRWMLRVAQIERRNRNSKRITHKQNAQIRKSILSGDLTAYRTVVSTAEVEQYLRNGNVTLIGLSATEEVEVLFKLKQFFIDFADVLNFDMHNWHRLILAVYRPLPSSRSSSTVTKTFEAHQVDEHRWILKLPLNFKRKDLLNALRIEIPFVRMAALL